MGVTGKIFRSVVFAGAMLGTPLAMADDKSDLAAIDARIKVAVDDVANAPNAKDRDAAKAKLDALLVERKALSDKQTAAKQAPPKSLAVVKLEGDVTAARAKLEAALRTFTAAETEADRKAAKAAVDAAKADLDRANASLKLQQLKDDKAAADAKAAQTKAQGKPAPPTPDEVKLAQLQQQQTELNAKVSAAIDAVVAAQTDADRKAAKARLDALRTEKAELDTKVDAQQSKVIGRFGTIGHGRGTGERPKGRGFVLA